MIVRFIIERIEQTGPDSFVPAYSTVDADVPELDGKVYAPDIKSYGGTIRGVELLPATQQDRETT